MKLLVSTPAAGGMLYLGYVGSLLNSLMQGAAEGLYQEFQPHFQGKESLIHRARNRAAMYAFENGFDKLITIDADISWTYEQFKRLITSPHPIIGGTYPLKTFPIVMNFNPLPDRGTELFSSNRGMDFDAFSKFKAKYADKDGIAEVRHLPTGFLCISREVLEKMGETADIYEEFDSASGERNRFMNFYPSQVEDGMLLSEDWGFMERARTAGFKVMFDTNCITTHSGTHDYRLGQFYGEQQS